jgi:hypothetical protein
MVAHFQEHLDHLLTLISKLLVVHWEMSIASALEKLALSRDHDQQDSPQE